MTAPRRSVVGALAGATVEVRGPFSQGLTEGEIGKLLLALGARVRAPGATTPTHTLEGAGAAQLAALLGPGWHDGPRNGGTPARSRVLDETELVRLVRDELGFESLRAALRELQVASSGPAAGPLASALIATPAGARATALRRASELEARRDADALQALCEVMHTERASPCAVDEAAAALGRLVAAGCTRWKRPGQFALEFEPPRDTRTATQLIVRARRAGACEALHDARGVRVYRIALAPPTAPPPPSRAAVTRAVHLARAAADGVHPLYGLLAIAGSRAGTRLWLGGVSVRSPQRWSTWLALLAPLVERARSATHAPGSALDPSG